MTGVLYMIMCCGIQEDKSARQSPLTDVYKKKHSLKCYYTGGRGESVALGQYVHRFLLFLLPSPLL